MNAPVATPPWLQRQLETLVRERSHAVLLFGSGGTGQYELALDLARAWLCESPQQQDRSGRACGACGSCHAIEVRTHADLLVLMPETIQIELGWPLPEKAQSDIDEKRRKASREIRVDAMRDAVEFAQRTSGRGQSKIVLVYPAEHMNAVTANALLKTLEEPPGSVRFILATEAAHELLPTIRSRCLAHALHLPEPQEARQWMTQSGVPEADAPALLAACGGRPTLAVQWWQAGRSARSWSAIPRGLQQGRAEVLEGFSPREMVESMQKLCHDLMVFSQGCPPRFFRPEDLPNFKTPVHVGTLTAWNRYLARMEEQIDHPFHPGLLVDALVDQAANTLNSTA
jgi:DNA polymerase-3 subunit delta'